MMGILIDPLAVLGYNEIPVWGRLFDRYSPEVKDLRILRVSSHRAIQHLHMRVIPEAQRVFAEDAQYRATLGDP